MSAKTYTHLPNAGTLKLPKPIITAMDDYERAADRLRDLEHKYHELNSPEAKEAAAVADVAVTNEIIDGGTATPHAEADRVALSDALWSTRSGLAMPVQEAEHALNQVLIEHRDAVVTALLERCERSAFEYAEALKVLEPIRDAYVEACASLDWATRIGGSEVPWHGHSVTWPDPPNAERIRALSGLPADRLPTHVMAYGALPGSTS